MTPLAIRAGRARAPASDNIYWDSSGRPLNLVGDAGFRLAPADGAPAPAALGGPHSPALIGTTGNDVITGTPLADTIVGDWGDDVIDGGDGDDIITDSGGSNVLRGGGGGDFIRLSNMSMATAHGELVRTNLVEAGDGNDGVQVDVGVHQLLTVDLGAGNDLLTFSPPYIFDNEVQVTTGSGADRIVLGHAYGNALRSGDDAIIVVTDFTVGNGGDILDVGGLLKGLLSYTTYASNPFASGHLRLIQDGADVIVRIDLDGSGPQGDGFYIRDVARLTNVNVGALTAYNLAGYDPNGSAPSRTAVSGTAAGEWLNAGVGGSDMFGLDGDDWLTGGVRSDLIEGGAGNDHIEGGFGDDILRGGDGDDVLTDGYGHDTIEGGAGNDIIAIVRPALAPLLAAIHEQITIDAGDGDDFVSFLSEFENDNRREVTLSIDLGAGNDRVEFFHIIASGAQLTLGAGQDRVVFDRFYFHDQGYGEANALDPLVITDFAAGDGGDILELDSLLITGEGEDVTGNPFSTGHLRLQQAGADTLVVYDYYGTGNAFYFHTIAVLADVAAASLTAFNFSGYAPNGSASSYTLIGGTPGDDHLFGSWGTEAINGGAGNDRIEELKGGFDTLSGGDGDDVIIVAHPNWTQTAEVVTIDAGSGNDRVEFAGNWGRLNADLGAGDDRIRLFSAPEQGAFLTLGAGADVVTIDSILGSQVGGTITITDFAAGAGGDRLDWAMFAEIELSTYHPFSNPFFMDMAHYNPFLAEDARLVQSGADTLLQLNRYANMNRTPDYQTLVTFKNISAASFTDYNLGYSLFVPTLAGSGGNDALAGTAGADIIAGNGGNDQLDGLGGDDLLRGHEGDDILNGGGGLDHLYGGDGVDSLNGGDDADWLSGGAGRDTVVAGAGNDTILDTYAEDVIFGGTGNDVINVTFSTGPGWTPGSINAGDGNDLVTIVNGPDLAYSIDLGAGDDQVHINYPVTLLLGPGRDIVSYHAFNRTSGTLVLTDFTAGDGGDVFDLLTCITGSLQYGGGNHLLDQGHDPFALGYAELRQVGNNVELFFYPDGTNDDHIYVTTPLARFVNMNVAQFTAANFGGYDPHAEPNRTTVIEHDVTIAAGEIVDAVNVAPFQVFLTDFRSGHFLFRNSSPADFVNHGTVTSRSTEAGFSLVGIVVQYGGSVGGSFVNAADGRFIVESTWADLSGDVSSGRTVGFYAAAQSVLFRNDGYFEVSAASGTVTGLLAGYDVYHYYPIINNGTFVVTSAYDAIGLEVGNTAHFTNTGSITVSAGEFAIGVYLVNYFGTQFDNSGSITVTTGPGSPFASIGVLATHGLTAGTYTNSGSITADIAFLSDDSDSQTYDNDDHLINSGLIDGDIVMGNGADRVTNQGVISGYTDLGYGLDLYDGGAGFHSGIVDGGAHDDMLLGGAGQEILLGGTGDDRIYGAGGDDILQGGRGSDALDGGAGLDLISYLDSWASVTVDLAQGSAVGGGIDRLRDIEGVIGSAYADALTGSGGDDYLEGAGGNDVISGGGGADVILGDTGDDMLTGGAGADIFTVSTGDGADIVTDFNPLEDVLEIHGFTGATELRQVGADALVILAPSQSVLLRGVQTSSLTGAQLVFDPVPLGPAPIPLPAALGTQVALEGFLLYEGEVARIVNPDPVVAAEVLVRHTGVDSLSYEGTSSAIVAGSLILEVSADEGIAKGFFAPFEVTVLATGRVDVLTSGAVSAVGVYGGSLLNAGHVRVASTNSVAPMLDDYDISFTRPEVAESSAVGVFCDRMNAIFINNGTLEVSSDLISAGVLSYNNTENGGFWNSGDILVSGGLASIGVLFQGQGHPAIPQRPTFVNSGDIIVTDATALPDSIGLALSFTVPGGGLPASFWNSGLIQADYAIGWHTVAMPDTGGPANIYNSGELRGLVDLSFGAESLYNRGLITGRVELRGGSDLFDGRGGTQAAGVFGGAGNDTLLGGSGVDLIDGGADEDLIAGGGGGDMLTGGAGNDIFHVEAGFGADTITDFRAGTGEDSIRVSGYGSYQSLQQQGADTLVAFSATDSILLKNVVAADLTALDFVFSAAALASANIPAAPVQPVSLNYTLPFTQPPPFPPPQPMTLFGTPGADTLTGGDGDDHLNGGGGDDVLVGKGGNDVYIVDSAGDLVTEAAGEGRDVIYSSVGYTLGTGISVEVLAADSIVATTALNLSGNSFNNEIYGNNGANILSGGGGGDYLVGWGGDDTYFIQSGGEIIVEFQNAGRDVVYTAISYGLANGTYVEVLAADSIVATSAINLTGNSFNNEIYGNNGANVLSGGGGGDYLVGWGGDDTYFIQSGGEIIVEFQNGGRDVVYTAIGYGLANGTHVEVLAADSIVATTAINLAGNAFNNEIYGNNGNNILTGGGGGDYLVGWGGDDTYFIQSGGEIIVEALNGGRDVVYTAISYGLANGTYVEVLAADSIVATTAINLTGNSFNNEIYGNNGANILSGGGGGDYLVGWGGDDTYFIQSGGEIIVEALNGGRDVVYTAIGYTLAGGAHVEVLAADSIAATTGIDLTGNELGNEVYGNNGANTLNGGGGGDCLAGWGGADNFAFTTALGGGNVDILADFSAVDDTILLDNAVFAGLVDGALPPGAFVAGATAGDADDRIIYNSATGQIFFDADGSGAGAQIHFATVNAGTVLTAGDFTVI